MSNSGVFFRGLKMPSSCDVCPFGKYEDEHTTQCLVTGEKNNMFFGRPKCTARFIPNHGDLIDRDLLLNDVDPNIYEDRGDYAIFGYSTKQLLSQPAVISAHKDEVKE